MQENGQQQEQQSQSWSDHLINLRQEWTEEIKELNKGLVNINELDKLLSVVYSKRQDAVDLHYQITGIHQKQFNQYRHKMADLYNNFKNGVNGIRYSSDTAIYLQCEAVLTNEKNVIDELKNFAEFMWESVKSIDNLIFGIKEKMRIYEIQHGLKF